MTHPFDRSSRSRLTQRDAPRFAGAALFDRVARVVAGAECLPRKELYEAWEVARRVRRRERGGRVIDLACGHALVAHLMLILDDTSPTAIGVDQRVPLSAGRLAGAVVEAWPRLRGRVSITEGRAEDCLLGAGDLVVAVHACGPLTDAILDRVIAARARVAFMACCHDAAACDLGGLGGWLAPPDRDRRDPRRAPPRPRLRRPHAADPRGHHAGESTGDRDAARTDLA